MTWRQALLDGLGVIGAGVFVVSILLYVDAWRRGAP